jgi:hypothetical protein
MDCGIVANIFSTLYPIDLLSTINPMNLCSNFHLYFQPF